MTIDTNDLNQIIIWAFACTSDRTITSESGFWFDSGRRCIMCKLDGNDTIAIGATLNGLEESTCVLIAEGMNKRFQAQTEAAAQARRIAELEGELASIKAAAKQALKEAETIIVRLGTAERQISNLLAENSRLKKELVSADVEMRKLIDDGTKAYQERNEWQAQAMLTSRHRLDWEAERRALQNTIKELGENPLAAMIRERDDAIGVLSNEMDTLKSKAHRLEDLNRAVTEYLTALDSRVNTVDQEAARHTVEFLLSPAYVPPSRG